MTPEQLNDILQRYDNDRCTPEERAFVEAWYNNLRTPQDQLTSVNRDTIRARAREKLVKHVEHPDATQRPGISLWNTSWKVAAGLLLIAVTLFVLRGRDTAEPAAPVAVAPAPSMLAFANNSASPTRIMLSDGSTVTLRPQSEIRYPATFNNLREVYLSGEAFFEIKREEHKPFLVYANGVTTKVLGTSFLVTAYEGGQHVTVAVRTGRVAVFKPERDGITPRTGQEVILAPNQEVVYTQGEDAPVTQAVQQPATIALPPATKIRYEAAPVIQVLEDLIKTYGVTIQYRAEDFTSYTLTTTLSGESLDNRIGIICKAIGASYAVQGQVITINAPKRSDTTP
jgi:transmembrane sensor